MPSAVSVHKALLALALFGVAAGVARAESPPDDRILSELNYDFIRPNAPGVYRALAGKAAPFALEREAADGLFDHWPNRDPQMARLFPDFAAGGYFDPYRCRPDYALQTLKARTAQLGANHPYVARWAEVQRAVFAACGMQDAGTSDLPAALSLDDPVLARLQAYDRAYQSASLAFYKGDRPGALAAFRKIAASPSPHRAAAVYMIAAIRAGSDASGRFESGDKPMVDEAQSIREVRAILSDPGLISVHPLAQELLGWIGAHRDDPATRRAQVKATLAALEAPAARLEADPRVRRQYSLARKDIDLLHSASQESDADPAWWLKAGPPAGFTSSKAMMDEARTDPMAAWALFPASYVQGRPWAPFTSHGAAGWSELEAFAQTRAARPGSAANPWKRLSFSLSRRYDANVWSRVESEETGAAKGDSQAIAALAFDFYHQVRTALSAPDAEGQEEALSSALAHMQAFPFKPSVPYSAAAHDGLQYLMSVGRIDDARRWRDGLIASDDLKMCCDSYHLLAILAEDPAHLAAVLNARSDAALPLQSTLSIAAMRALAQRPELSLRVRARFARIAWGRSYALGETIDPGLDQLTRTLNPQMTKGWLHPVGRPVRPGDHQVLLDVLRSPAVNILIADEDRDTEPKSASSEEPGTTKIDVWNHDDDNWWCRWKPGRISRDLQEMDDNAFFTSLDMKLVDGETAFGLRDQLKAVFAASYLARGQAPAEAAALSQVTCAPKLLTERVLAWVNEPAWIFWGREGQAEALALAVKTTHYGCYSDGPHSAYSKAAWVALHHRFPLTQWAIKTKYWYSCFYGAPCPAEGDQGRAP
jgi:hypothetical protein